MKYCFNTVGLIAIFLISISCKQPPISKSNLTEYRTFYKTHLPKPIGFVNDFEKIFTRTQLDSLKTLVDSFRNATTTQICIITLDSFCVDKDSFNNLILYFANTWGVGTKEKNNGITIGLSKLHKKIRICNGIGTEKVFSNQDTKAILDSFIIPPFKQGNYFNGLYNGVQKIIQHLNNKI